MAALPSHLGLDLVLELVLGAAQTLPRLGGPCAWG